MFINYTNQSTNNYLGGLNMSNLIGENLNLQLCTSVIEKIGIIHGSEYLKEFYTKCLKKMENKLSVTQKQELNKLLPYISNSLFLPPILTKMIENNVTFMEAIKLSKNEISETCARLTGTLKKIETNELLSNLIYSVFEKVCSIQDHAKDPKYVINASLSITTKIYDIIEKSNLLFITCSLFIQYSQGHLTPNTGHESLKGNTF